jgi:Spy/CpxP family protein refolding chaperone
MVLNNKIMKKEFIMKKRLSYIITGIVAVALIGSGFAFAQSKGLSILEGIPGINLDDAQTAKLQAKDVEHQKKMIKLRADHQIARVDVDNLLKDRNFKKDTAEKQIRNMMGIETDMELERLAQLHELRGVLTEAQWKVYAAHAGMGMCRMGGKGMKGKGMKGCYGMMGGAKDSMGPNHKGMGNGKGMGKGNCPYMNNTADDTKK